MKSLSERIEIETHFLNGGPIQAKGFSDTDWRTINLDPIENYVFLWNHNDYRKNKEPLEVWINVNKDGSIGTRFYESESYASENSNKEHWKQYKFIQVLDDD
ncbi:MAG: hypothetical protein ACUZ8H_02200 [Candidatus Anammoxibacter sp.]